MSPLVAVFLLLISCCYPLFLPLLLRRIHGGCRELKTL
jgi:hypothetical protein